MAPDRAAVVLAVLVCGAAGANLGCALATGPIDGAAPDAVTGMDSAVGEASLGDAAGPPADVLECVPGSTCAGGLTCRCCPSGPVGTHCLCTTLCAPGMGCPDPTRPFCNLDRSAPGTDGLCTPSDYVCAWGVRCAAADTPVATPAGERAIAEIAVGDVVWGARDGRFAPVRVLRVARTAVFHHTLVRVTLRGGRAVEMSAGHPTADGRRFGELAADGALGGRAIERVERVPYAGAYTHDLLTDGDRGAYVAAGVLVGSTLAPEP